MISSRGSYHFQNGFEWGSVTNEMIGQPLLLNLSAGVDYNFAIAVNYAGGVQGPLTWSKCTFITERGKFFHVKNH